MQNLTYWNAECLNGSGMHDVRAKTKKECEKLREAFSDGSFGEPKKVMLKFEDAFQLLDSCLGEDRGLDIQTNNKTEISIETCESQCKTTAPIFYEILIDGKFHRVTTSKRKAIKIKKALEAGRES